MDDLAAQIRGALARSSLTPQQLAEALGVNRRTVSNWTSRTKPTKPSDADLAGLRRLLGDFDSDGDPVEVALRASGLSEDRVYVVLAAYKRQLREQAAEDEGAQRGA